MIDKLIEITNQLLDLGKRNRLLNFKDTGLKTLKILNKGTEEAFRGIKAGKEYRIYPVDSLLNALPSEMADEDLEAKVYELANRLLEPRDFLCFKRGYPLSKVLKSLSKDYKFTTTEKGINPLYISFGFIHYEEDGTEYTAPLLLIPIELGYEAEEYTIKEYEDEVILNPTLKYYLSSRFSRELPDYNNDSLPVYYSKIKEQLPEETVLEDGIALGIYSFYKMNMYNDLMLNKEIVIQNQNIQALLNEKQPPASRDSVNQPIYPVVNCDSSQLEAIQFAANGKSFCLQGPPGSGKSQTITNIISSLLGSGKKILFVSEKIAALRVVYENLRRAKLNDFAVELHSNKANKKEFIENIYKTATLPKYEMDFKSKFLGTKYEALKANLDLYEKELHSMIPSMEMSLVDLYSAYLSIEAEPINFFLDVEHYNLYDLDKTISLLNEYKSYCPILGYDYRKNPLYGLTLPAEGSVMDGLGSDIEDSVSCLRNFCHIQALAARYTDIPITNIEEAIRAIPILWRLIELKSFSAAYLNEKSRDRLRDTIEKYLLCSKSVKSALFDVYTPSIIQEDIDELARSYREALADKGLFKNSKRVLKELNEKIGTYRKEKAKPEQILVELEELSRIKRNLNMAVTYGSTISKALGDIRSLNLASVLADLKQLDGIGSIQMEKEGYERLKEELVLPQLSRLELYRQSLRHTADLFAGKDYLFQMPLSAALSRLEEINQEKNHILLYHRMTETLTELKKYNAFEYLNAYLETGRDIEEIAAVYKKMFYKQKIDMVLQSSSLLKDFRSMGEEEIIAAFRRLDEQILSLNRDYIIALNSQRRPDEAVIDGSEFKILTREFNKLRCQLPIRTLLEQTFELVLDIKPVFLMSPLSVSTYLASKLEMFDCVIFDEASQIFASDALGSIYRAKQCIVIGDTKQMPPTSFFQASTDDIAEKEYDLESILDKASTVFATTSLKWHYRSRSEELITFSNLSFYNSNLITIPQAKKHEVGFGIDFYYVENGRYDTGSRTNAAEANQVCDMVFEHFKTSKKSLGVVAFSNVQAELISSLIEKRIKKEPELEKYLREDIDEPFFVKNLESVQGDERDRIIFSICYGYNQENKFYQRFGPLNNLGGERRLNVAITRAKYNISIVSSIRYTDIRANTEALGVLLLRSYLEFAEHITTNKNYSECENGITASVRSYLEELGYTVLANYGSSSFKIDLAVKKEDEFVLAIMIDGRGQYSSNLTDKYRLEKLLLERLGWKYFKLYSTAWIHNPELEKARLYEALTLQPQQIASDTSVFSYLKVDNSMASLDSCFLEYEELPLAEAKRLYEEEGLEKMLVRLVEIETPIHEEYLYRKTAAVFDRVNANAALKELVQKTMPKRILKIGEFYFSGQISDIRLRLHSGRDIAQIYPDELSDGIYTIVSRNNGIQAEGCYKTLSGLLGFEKIMPNIRHRFNEAAERLKAEGKIMQRKDCLYLAE